MCLEPNYRIFRVANLQCNMTTCQPRTVVHRFGSNCQGRYQRWGLLQHPSNRIVIRCHWMQTFQSRLHRLCMLCCRQQSNPQDRGIVRQWNYQLQRSRRWLSPMLLFHYLPIQYGLGLVAQLQVQRHQKLDWPNQRAHWKSMGIEHQATMYLANWE